MENRSALRSEAGSIAAKVVGAALVVFAAGIPVFMAAVRSDAFYWNWPTYALVSSMMAILGIGLIMGGSSLRRRGLIAAAFACCALALPAGCVLWANLQHYGSEPSYAVPSLGELEDDLARDCPDMGFPDLSAYDAGAFEYRVDYVGGRLTMRNRGYRIWSEDAPSDGRASSLATLSVKCTDLRQFDGHYRVAPAFEPNALLGGIGVEHGERLALMEADGGNSAEDGIGRESFAFVIGAYRYEVSAAFEMPSGTDGDEADSVRRAACGEVASVALSIIEG